jgi:N-6 DNA Methylase
MMQRIINNLHDAKSYMPDAIPGKIRNDMLLTLIFLQLLSEAWYDDLAQGDKKKQVKCPVMFDAQCDFKTCLVPYQPAFSSTPRGPWHTAAAIQAALTRLALIQPDGILNGVLRPERFSPQAFQDNTNLDHALMEISTVRVKGVRGKPAMDVLFAVALRHLPVGRDTLTTELAPLMAKLLHPQPSEIMYAPDCGHGQLATACIDASANCVVKPNITVYGWEANSDKWALARMQLLLRGVGAQDLQNTSYPAEPPHTAFDVGMVCVPVTARHWQPGHAWFDLIQRSSGALPQDSRMAPAWLAVSNMKPRTGRCALLVPLSVLREEGGRRWRQHVAEQNVLQAVISVPPLPRIERAGAHLLILLSRQKPASRVAFIGARQPNAQCERRNYHDYAILNAMQCFQEGRSDAYLFEADTAALPWGYWGI